MVGFGDEWVFWDLGDRVWEEDVFVKGGVGDWSRGDESISNEDSRVSINIVR